MTTFTPRYGRVIWNTERGPAPLTDGFVDMMLDALEIQGQREPLLIPIYHELYEAQREALAELHIPRENPFRLRSVAA